MSRKSVRYQEIRFKLQEDYYEEVKLIARDEEVSVSYLINEIIGSFLEAAKNLDADGQA
jgi:predicted DNA-binding ribbon-helix-helix protein